MYDFLHPNSSTSVPQHQGEGEGRGQRSSEETDAARRSGEIATVGDRNWVAMEGAERDEALSTFIAVTGAPYERAREVLDTNDWDLQRALNTHLEVQQHTTSNTAGVAAQRTQQQSSVAAGLQGGNVIDLADDIMDEISLQRRRGGVEANAPPIQTQPLQSRLSANEGEVLDLDAEDANERSEANRSAGAANAVDADRNFIEEQLLKQALEERFVPLAPTLSLSLFVDPSVFFLRRERFR